MARQGTWAVLYCNTATVAATRRAGVGWARGRWAGVQVGAGRRRAHAERTGGVRRTRGQALQAAGARARGVRSRRRQARGARDRQALGARGEQAGPVLVLVHLAWFSTWFFDSVFFLSH